MPKTVTKRCLVCRRLVRKIRRARLKRMRFKFIYCSVECTMDGMLWRGSDE